jgi:hypothetical protein
MLFVRRGAGIKNSRFSVYGEKDIESDPIVLTFGILNADNRRIRIQMV